MKAPVSVVKFPLRSAEKERVNNICSSSNLRSWAGDRSCHVSGLGGGLGGLAFMWAAREFRLSLLFCRPLIWLVSDNIWTVEGEDAALLDKSN